MCLLTKVKSVITNYPVVNNNFNTFNIYMMPSKGYGAATHHVFNQLPASPVVRVPGSVPFLQSISCEQPKVKFRFG